MLISLGEVDVGFLVFLRAQENSHDVRAYTDIALTRYQEFVRQEVLARGARPIMISASMPTVESYSAWNGLNGLRRKVGASRAERAAETTYWNDRCAEWCRSAGGVWLDLTPATTYADGRVRQEYLNEDPENHHLRRDRYRTLVVGMLRDIGF